MGAERKFGAFGLDGAFDGGLDHVVVVVQPREVNCEPPILLYLSVMRHMRTDPGLCPGKSSSRVDVSVMAVFVKKTFYRNTTRPYLECFFGQLLLTGSLGRGKHDSITNSIINSSRVGVSAHRHLFDSDFPRLLKIGFAMAMADAGCAGAKLRNV